MDVLNISCGIKHILRLDRVVDPTLIHVPGSVHLLGLIIPTTDNSTAFKRRFIASLGNNLVVLDAR
jgi:hypothetical protein